MDQCADHSRVPNIAHSANWLIVLRSSLLRLGVRISQSIELAALWNVSDPGLSGWALEILRLADPNVFDPSQTLTEDA